MGTAILSAVINKKLVTPADVTVSDISTERLEVLRRQYDVNVTSDNRQAVSGADVVVFSIKPQTVPEVLPELKNTLKPSQLVLSIMAGIRLETLVESGRQGHAEHPGAGIREHECLDCDRGSYR